MFPENAGINIIPSLLYRDVRVVIGVIGCYRDLSSASQKGTRG